MLLIVDGTNVVMRYASAMAPTDHEPDEAEVAKILGSVTRAMLECARLVSATHLIVALDSGVGSWRRERFPEYKAKRTASTLVWTNRLNVHCTAEGIHCVRAPEFEADDVIATLAARTQKVGKLVSILSGDSDMLQLATLGCTVLQFGKQPAETRFVARTLAWIREKYELTSAGHLAAYKALVGEPGDGIPGVPGIGPVKARKILGTATSLDDIPLLLPTPSDVDAYKLALELVTLREDVPLDLIHPAECRVPHELARANA